ncbi:VCBS repeat-containing protein [Spongiimicrobium sp. 3-5]|uniref:VCBS repeat-containing protein n=1 Tax=Spongiimicrobium sp. 3-5 TaxID=3332596 RepID=UPI003980AE1B
MKSFHKKILPFLVLSIIFSCQRINDDKLFSVMPASKTSIKFKNLLRETEEFNVLEYGYLYNGGGVAIGDINNDGWSDIYFTGNMVGSHLYLNKGNWEFEEIAKSAGVFAEGLWNTGTTMADVNGDGFLDIYICRSAAKNPAKRKNLLFINNGDLTFTEKGAEYGVDDSGYSTQGAFFDYDKDGDLDLYVLNHSTQEYAGFGQITASLKNRKNPSYSDKLYRNDNGKFTNVSDASGLISNVLGFGLGIAISDLNNDNWPDLYISNDYNEQDYLYINNQDGTFTESLEKYIGHTSLFSMGSDIADINNDGFTDIFTLDMLPEGNYRQKMVSGPDNYDKYQLLVNSGFYNQTMRNMLQLNNNGQSFSEIGQLSGISNTDWSWASLFADLDNDGHKDLFITNGYKKDYTNMDFMNYAVQEKMKEDQTGQQTAIMELLKEVPSTVEENYVYHNKGDLTFNKANQAWGLNQKSLSNGAAYGDLDNDGDIDLVVNNIEAEAFVYRNNSEKHNANNYLKVSLKGSGKNTFGIGAKVQITVNDQIITQEHVPTRGYQSSVDQNLVFGLGESTQIESLKVTWPNNKVQVLQNVAVNQTLVLKQAEAKFKEQETQLTGQTYFIDATQDSLINYKHTENQFVDFKKQQLLPHKLSTQGPRIAKGDINGDGLEDVFIGGAKGSIGSLYQQNTADFLHRPQQAFKDDLESEDVDAVFFDADNDGDQDLYIASGGYEYSVDSPELQDRLYLNSGNGNFRKTTKALPKMLTSSSCVKASDFDSDGDLDLFVGGRSVPGEYPTATRSYILSNDGNGNFSDVTESVGPALKNPGMVTDAIWTDFNNDGLDDLIVIGEFMGIRAFENKAGKLSYVDVLTDSQGWWNAIEEGDFDADGDMDYILGNFGSNSQIKASVEEPVQLFVSDFDNNGSIDPILCSYIMGESYPVFSKDDLLGQLNGLKSRYINYADYADQKITDIFNAEELANATVLEAKTFSTSYLENLGNNQFKLSALPLLSQFSPVFGILVQDFNQDGHLDVLLGGNFFGTRVKYGRYDANMGLLLLGDGHGNFDPSSNLESGLNINGEVRDITSITLSDKRELILVSRNNESLKTYTSPPKN